MAQSWFFLTLWRGTPPEMTDYLEATVKTGNEFGTRVLQKSAHTATVNTTSRKQAEIQEADHFGVAVNERDEVTWIVGTKN